MPEGDTVYRTAHHLAQVLLGATITEFDLRVPGAATVDLTGLSVTDVVPRGKHILHHIGDYTLHSHLRMEGTWHVYKRGTTWRRPAFQARAVVGSDAVQTVGFDLSGVSVVPREREYELVGHLGSDPLAADWNPAAAAEAVATDERPVHVALLDQRNIAGFGNEYVNEMLFVAGIDPHRTVSFDEAFKLVTTGERMMRSNLSRRGRVFTGDARPGRATWVFGRERENCRRCSTPLRTDQLGADATKLRNVFWCPRCQK
ncbi:DNA-formamidopyrimidine glycosylase family protein [Microbacterium sp. YY-03]|uniref:DNA-formamidopyrimidine glycosylase family protein n=1 Tax=Microbacterium sp. YY-03 TaxID=3421636 RepID=UPI003D179872